MFTIILKYTGMSLLLLVLSQIIRIFHEYECWIDKSVLRITIWHHKACFVMPIGDPRDHDFLSYQRSDDGFFFTLTIKFHFFIYIFF